MIKKVNNDKILYLTMFAFMIFMHTGLDFSIGDDPWFLERTTINLGVYLQQRYDMWTSRIIIEAVMLSLLRLPRIIWIVLNSGMFVIILYSIKQLCHIKDDDKGYKVLLLVALCMILIPFKMYNEAGWYATTLNYVWPLAFGLLFLTVIQKKYLKEKVKWYQVIGVSLPFLYASNQEQMCLLLLGFEVLFICMYYFKYKEFSKTIIVFLLLTLGMLAMHLLCPGNDYRVIAETNNVFVTFSSFTMVDKFVLGYIFSGVSLLTSFNSIMIIFPATLCVLVVFSKPSKLDIVLSVVPLFIYIVLNLGRIVPGLSNFRTWMYENSHDLTQITYNVTTFMILCIVTIILSIIIYLIIKYTREMYGYWLAIIFCAGFASRLVIGFSPTVYASGQRTSLFLYYGLIIIIAFISKIILSRRNINESISNGS